MGPGQMPQNRGLAGPIEPRGDSLSEAETWSQLNGYDRHRAQTKESCRDRRCKGSVDNLIGAAGRDVAFCAVTDVACVEPGLDRNCVLASADFRQDEIERVSACRVEDQVNDLGRAGIAESGGKRQTAAGDRLAQSSRQLLNPGIKDDATATLVRQTAASVGITGHRPTYVSHLRLAGVSATNTVK